MNIRLHSAEHAYLLNDPGARILVYHEQCRDHLASIRAELASVERSAARTPQREGDGPCLTRSATASSSA